MEDDIKKTNTAEGDVSSQDETNQNDEKNNEVTFTQEQQRKIDEIIERRVAQEKKKADDKAKAAAKEAEKLAKMNKDQKTEYERELMEKELKELREEKQLNQMRTEARSMLNQEEVDSSDEVVDLVVADTAEKTKNNVEAFTKVVKRAIKEAVKVNARQSTLAGGDTFTNKTNQKSLNLAELAREKRIIK